MDQSGFNLTLGQNESLLSKDGIVWQDVKGSGLEDETSPNVDGTTATARLGNFSIKAYTNDLANPPVDGPPTDGGGVDNGGTSGLPRTGDAGTATLVCFTLVLVASGGFIFARRRVNPITTP